MPSLPFTLRRMQEHDLDQVVALERQLFPDPWSRRAFAAELANPLSYPWVAMQSLAQGAGEQVLGYLVLWVQGESGEIANFAVAPEYQGQGIGSALFQQALRTARALGLKKLGLEVRMSNQRALQWYLRRGFRIVRRLPGYYRVGSRGWEDGWRMELTLDHPQEEIDVTSAPLGSVDPTDS